MVRGVYMNNYEKIAKKYFNGDTIKAEKLVDNYINSKDLEIDVDTLEADFDFMNQAIETSKDPKMFLFASDELKENFSFVKKTLELCGNDLNSMLDVVERYFQKNKSNEEIPVYSVTNTQGFCRDYFGKEVASKDKTTYKIVPRGYFAYNPSRINVGSVDWQREEERVIVSPLYNVFSVSPELNQQYLYYFLKSDIALQMIRTVATGSVRDNLKLEMLKEFSINLPTLLEQKAIVENLDKLKRVISLREAELKKLDDLIKARFVELFGDPMTNPKDFPIKTIEEVSILNKGITYSPEDVAEEGMIVLRSSNIKGNIFDLEDLVKVTKQVPPDKFVQENDILMCNRNGSARLVGKVAMIPKLEKNMTFGTFMTIVRSDIYEYLFVFFQMDAFREQIKFQTAVAINQISLPLLASVKVPVPPKELIDEFSVFTKQVDKSKVAIQKSLNETQLLFDSLMQEYFG